MRQTLITYLGGSGGDLFAASLNNITLDFEKNLFVDDRSSYSIKQHENKIAAKEVDLNHLLMSYTQEFISTHLYHELEMLHNHKISLLCRSKDTEEKLILRQMQLQNLSIEINYEQKFFPLLLSLCKKQRFEQAAKFWFEMSKKLWQENMSNRLKKTLNNSTKINIDEIFTPWFYDSIAEQKKLSNLGILKKNHHSWLKKNNQFDYKKTISAMESKLSVMDWAQQTGTIKYKSSHQNL